MWLLFERSDVGVCEKDPGFPVNLRIRGNIGVFVAVYLGHEAWRDVAGKALLLDGDPRIGKQLPDWLRLGDVRGREPYDMGPRVANGGSNIAGAEAVIFSSPSILEPAQSGT